jgi:glycosyltransferase involved in cell wall biosynthesis
MRVSHVITRLIVGGAQENTVATVLGLMRKPGVTVDLISGPSSAVEGTLEPEFAAHPGVLKILPSLVRPVHPWQDTRATFALAREYRASRPDIVHTHSGKAGFVGRLGARLAGVKCIVHTIHGPSFGPFQGALANLVYKTAERTVAPITTHFVSVAQAMTDQYLEAGIGSPERYTRIFSGFPLEPFLAIGKDAAERARWGLSPGDFVVAKIARLFELKGHDELVAAAAQLAGRVPNIKFLLIGDGPLRGRIEADVRDRGLQKFFVFAGLVKPADVPRTLGAADVVAHLSMREGLPRALSQALAAGKPVVAYDRDGAREVCLNGETGFLVDAKSPNRISRLVERIEFLARDPVLRERLGQTGREFVRRNFSVEKMVDDILALYQKLLAR